MENKTLPTNGNHILWEQINIGDNFFITVPNTTNANNSFTYDFTTLGLNNAIADITLRVGYFSKDIIDTPILHYVINPVDHLFKWIVSSSRCIGINPPTPESLWRQTIKFPLVYDHGVVQISDTPIASVIIRVESIKYDTNIIFLKGLHVNNSGVVELKVVGTIKNGKHKGDTSITGLYIK